MVQDELLIKANFMNRTEQSKKTLTRLLELLTLIVAHLYC